MKLFVYVSYTNIKVVFGESIAKFIYWNYCHIFRKITSNCSHD